MCASNDLDLGLILLRFSRRRSIDWLDEVSSDELKNFVQQNDRYREIKDRFPLRPIQWGHAEDSLHERGVEDEEM